MKRSLFLLAASLACAGPVLGALPTSISAEYDLKFSGVVIGHVSETYARNGEAYEIRSVARSEGALKRFFDDEITMKSSGRVIASGLQPLAFRQRRSNSTKGAISATFDWARGVMTSDNGHELTDSPLPAGTQDRVSVLYQFMFVTPTALVSISMSNGRKVELYSYRRVGEERIATPAGAFDTIHYQRVTQGKESQAEVWIAPAHFNFPVRVAFEDSHGLRVEEQVVSLLER